MPSWAGCLVMNVDRKDNKEAINPCDVYSAFRGRGKIRIVFHITELLQASLLLALDVELDTVSAVTGI